MDQFNFDQLQIFCEKHDLTVHECARLIGVSTQTLYNALSGKSLKSGTQEKITRWMINQHLSHHEWSLSGGIESLTNAFQSYRDSVQKEWQRNMPKMSYEDQLAFLEALRQLDMNFEHLLRHHDVFLRVLAASDPSERQSG